MFFRSLLKIVAAFSGIFLLWAFLKEKNEKEGEAKLPLEKYNEKMQKQKDISKDAIVSMLKSRGEVRNNDVQQKLLVSDATATRYLNELEKEGRIVSLGHESTTFYRLIH